MRSVVAKSLAVAVAIVMAFGFAAPIAAAQDYPPVVPIQPTGPSSNTPGNELLAVINANAAASSASSAAGAAETAAANGDAAGAAAYADNAAAYAAKAAAELAAGQASGFSSATIAQLQAASNAAAASASAAANSAKNVSVPAVSVPVPNLAFTGGSASLPVALGAALVGAGGLALLAARKRELAEA